MRPATSQAILAMPGRSTVLIALSLLLCGRQDMLAAEPNAFLPPESQHSLYRGDLPPGVVGQARLGRRGPVANYFQPVKFAGPQGIKFALAQNGAFGQSAESLMAGLLIGSVYRFQITQIPGAEGVELYPTVELIDRTYPPENMATLYPIPIVLDESDLEAAMAGRMVTRVVYLEDPQTAFALPGTPTSSHVMDVSYYQDPLKEADRLGRPVAIVRMGSVTPPTAPDLLPHFFFGYPPWAPVFQPQQ